MAVDMIVASIAIMNMDAITDATTSARGDLDSTDNYQFSARARAAPTAEFNIPLAQAS
jgi:hypothetical protein